MKFNFIPAAFIFVLMAPFTALAAPPALQTPAPVIYLAENLDEKDKLGWLHRYGRARVWRSTACPIRASPKAVMSNSNTTNHRSKSCRLLFRKMRHASEIRQCRRHPRPFGLFEITAANVRL